MRPDVQAAPPPSAPPQWDTARQARKVETLCQSVDGRRPVYFVHDPGTMYLPLSLGMLFARLHTYQSGALLQLYRPLALWDLSPAQIATVASVHGPGVWLFSDYLWTLETNLLVSRFAKQLSPANLVVHGGPSAPKYPEACRRFLREHPEVDLVVRGEGEDAICQLLGRLAVPNAFHEPRWLDDIAGVAYAPDPEGELVRGPDRGSGALEAFPSPYLAGHFDDYTAPIVAATIETNRGCPYGCTFCDWGSATLQKIRNFDLERVSDEIRWIGEHRVKVLWIADANFGIFERDVELTERIAEVKREVGYPQQVIVNYAKNATRRLADVVRILRDAGIHGQGIIASQSTDPATLAAVRRSNIKTDRYDELAAIFEDEGLLLSTDLMIGLPGSTIESFKNDLQHYFDRGIAVKAYPTTLLPNSPMADPEYMEEYAIEVDAERQLVATSTYTREDREHMLAINKLYNLFVDYGLLRYVLRYLQWDHGVRALDLVDAAARAAEERSAEFPSLAWLLAEGWPKPLPPLGWLAFHQEVARLLESELGVASTPTLAGVQELNARVMPMGGRLFPDRFVLAHDFVQYWRDHQRSSSPAAGGPVAVRRLEDYPPGSLTITDPHGQCDAIFRDNFLYHMQTIHWELDSELYTAGMRPKLIDPSEMAAPSLAAAS